MRERFLLGSLFLGIAIALKGFALVVLPALFFFIFARKGFGVAIACVFLSLAPFAICNLLVYANTGLEGLAFPYRFHAIRSFNGQSTWDAFGIQYLVNTISILPTLVIAVCSSLCSLETSKIFRRIYKLLYGCNNRIRICACILFATICAMDSGYLCL